MKITNRLLMLLLVIAGLIRDRVEPGNKFEAALLAIADRLEAALNNNTTFPVVVEVGESTDGSPLPVSTITPITEIKDNLRAGKMPYLIAHPSVQVSEGAYGGVCGTCIAAIMQPAPMELISQLGFLVGGDDLLYLIATEQDGELKWSWQQANEPPKMNQLIISVSDVDGDLHGQISQDKVLEAYKNKSPIGLCVERFDTQEGHFVVENAWAHELLAEPVYYDLEGGAVTEDARAVIKIKFVLQDGRKIEANANDTGTYNWSVTT